MTGAFLATLQLSDTALPIGRFVHSAGLEELLRTEERTSEVEIVELVESVLLHAIGPLDGVAVAEAYRAAGRGDLESLLHLDRRVTLYKLAPGSRSASSSCGRQLASLSLALVEAEPASTLARLVLAGETPGNLAIVEGALAQALDIGLEESVLVELRGAAAGLLSAAVRLGRLSAFRAQRALRLLEPALLESGAAAVASSADAFRSQAPELEVYALRHFHADGRLFAT